MIDFLSNVFDSNKYKRLKLDDYAILCTSCAQAIYKPYNWEEKIVPAIKEAEIQKTDFYKQIDLALTLNQLGIHHEEFVDHLLKSAEIQVLYKNDSRLDQVQKVYANEKNELKQKVNNQPSLSTYLTWLTSDVETFIGANKVLNNVMVSKDLTVPLVMKVNTETGDFIDMKSKSMKHNLICNENELM